MEVLLPPVGPLRAPLPPFLPSFPAVDAVSFGKAAPSGLSRRVPRATLSLVHVSPPAPLRSSPSRPPAAAVAAVGPSASPRSRWVVVLEKPPARVGSARADIIDYYVETLARVLGDEKEAQMCMYDASWQSQFRFCCDIDEEASRELAGLSGVLSVSPGTDLEPVKNGSYSNSLLSYLSRSEGHAPKFSSSGGNSNYWLVRMRKPGVEVVTKAQMVDYYAETLTKVLGSEKDAQACIYHISWERDFGFCCQIDEECAQELADVPGVIHVLPDTNFDSKNKEYRGLSEVLSVSPGTDLEPVKNGSYSNSLLSYLSRSEGHTPKFSSSGGNSNYWLVRMRKPGVEVVTKAQIVDYYAETLTKVLGNEKDAQACIYHISWERDFGFCCQIDEECAQELAGDIVPQKSELPESPDRDPIPNIKTKRLFVTGLSFYTSEKTLRAAFEGFGELVEVKIIMDKISKRSKGYAFIEYTTEAAASAALKEMNGKIINGWMIVVDVAKTNPPRYNRDRRPPSDPVGSSY